MIEKQKNFSSRVTSSVENLVCHFKALMLQATIYAVETFPLISMLNTLLLVNSTTQRLGNMACLGVLKNFEKKSIPHKLKGVLANSYLAYSYEWHKSQIASHFKYLTKTSRCQLLNLKQRFALCQRMCSLVPAWFLCVFLAEVTASYGSIRF